MTAPLASLVDRLTEAGASPQILNIVVQAVSEMEAVAAKRRADGRERTKRWREERKRQANGPEAADDDETGDVTSPERHGDARVTLQTPPLSPPDKSPPDPQKLTPPITPPPEGMTRGRAGAHRLPADWQPEPFGPRTKAAARLERMGEAWAEQELESFTNHWRASGTPNARKCDWQAAWAEWLRLAEERGGPRNGRRQTDYGNRREPRPDPALAMWRQARAEAGSEGDKGADWGIGFALPAE